MTIEQTNFDRLLEGMGVGKRESSIDSCLCGIAAATVVASGNPRNQELMNYILTSEKEEN